MGNICAADDEEIDLLSADLDGRETPRPPTVGVPSLLDLCLEQLAVQLLGNDKDNEPKPVGFVDMKERYEPPSRYFTGIGGEISFEMDSIPLRGYSSDREDLGYSFEMKKRSKKKNRRKKRYIGLCTEPDALLPNNEDEITDSDFRTRAPELLISPPSSPTPVVLKLAPTIVQAIFNRMVEKKLLNVSNLRLFTGSQLTSISLTSYPKVTDRWFNILFSHQNSPVSPSSSSRDGPSPSRVETKTNTPSSSSSSSSPPSSVSSHSSPLSSYSSPLSLSSASPPPSLSTPGSSPRTPPLSEASHMAQSLTYFDVSKCDQLTDRALRPLMLCHALKHLNFEGCIRLTDDLLCDITSSTPYLEYLNCGGCREVTDRLLENLQESKHNLHTLILESCNMTDRGLLCLREMKRLVCFSVGWCGNDVTNAGLTWLKGNPNLEDVNFAHTGIETLDFLCKLKNLTKVNIAGTNTTEAGLRFVQGVFPRLRELDMQKTKCQEIPLGFLHYNLQSLDASFCRNIPPGKYTLQLAQLAEMSAPCSLPMSPGYERSHCQLSILNLEGSRLNNTCMKSLCSLVELRQLNICDTDVTDEGFAYLPQLVHLNRLNCSGCKISNAALSALESMSTLTEIHMNCQAITDAGVFHLRNLHNLQTLDLFEATLTDTGIDHLVNMRELKCLELCGGQLTNAGLAKFPVLSNLTSLNVSQNPGITDAGLLPLATLKSLTHINLSGTQVTDKGLSFLHALPSIRAVSLFGCKVKQSPKLKALIPKVRIGVDSNIALAAV